MKELNREELITLVQKIKDCNVPEQEQRDMIHLLRTSVADPKVTDYIFWFEPALSAEKIIDKALTYKPSQ